MEMGHVLCTITNPQDRTGGMELREIKMRRIFLPYRIRAAGKDDSFYSAVNFGIMIEGVDLTVNIELPDAARDELGELRAKVKNEDFFLHGQR